MFITKELLIEKGACSSGLISFEEHFPHGGDYQSILDKLAEENHREYALWLLHNFGNLDTVLETDELTIETSLFFAGRVVVKGAIKVARCLISGWGIEAGEGIEAGWGIEAGRGIKAGWGIKAGEGIEAGCDFGIYAGLRIRISHKKQYAVIRAKEEPVNIVCGEYIKTEEKRENIV